MSDRPVDDSQANKPEEPTPPGTSRSSEPLSGWHTPETPDSPTEAAASADSGAPSTTDSGAWFSPSPDEEESQPVEGHWFTPEDSSAPALDAAVEEGSLPGTWYQPPSEEEKAAASSEPQVADGGWHVPADSAGAAILSGVDETIHPQPIPAEENLLLPEQEPVPVDEETTLTTAEAVPEPVLTDDRLLVDDSGTESDRDRLLVDDYPTEQISRTDEPVLGTSEERNLYESGDSASIAAAMAARVAGTPDIDATIPLPEEAGAVEDTFFPRAGDAATVAAQKAAELAGEEPPLTPEVTGALERLAAQFDNVEAQVGTLRELYHQGQLSRDALQAELRKLMILDDQGIWWMVGLESNTWYRFDNNTWQEAERPRRPGLPITDDDMLAPSYMGVTQASGPVLESVPRVDPGATLVGASAVQFGELETDMQPTIPTPVQTAGPAQQPYAGQAQQPVYQDTAPDYAAAYTDAAESDIYRQVQEEQVRGRRGLLVRVAVGLAFGVLGMVLVAIVGMILYYMSVINRYDAQINDLANLAAQFETTRIYDANGQLIAQLSDPTGGNRISVPLEQISPYLIHAVVSIEDERFYENPGWDPVAIGRAMIQNAFAGEIVSGASTITQQLAKLLVLEPERRTELSASRKIDEAIIAAEIGRRYTKNEILELYLNEVFFGNLSYGVEAAAQGYFDVSARDLNLPQSAMLAGIIACPASCDPITNRETTFDRMDGVLEKELEVNCLPYQHEPYASTGQPFCVTSADLQNAVVEKALVEIGDYSVPVNRTPYPHFVNYVIQELEQTYGLSDVYRTGFNVYTTLDPTIQQAAEQAVSDQIASLNARGIGGNNASVVVMDPRDGRLLAMVGSAGYNNEEIDGQVNVAFTPQQPGSSIKPLVYVTALQGDTQGNYWTPGTIIWDTPNSCWSGYCPTNYDGAYTGPVSLRQALANSRNIPAVKALDFVGTERFQQTASVMGLTYPGNTPVESGLPGALGGFDVRLFDMVVAYGTLANNGQRVEPFAIARIEDGSGSPVPLPDRQAPQQVIQPEHAYLITHILSDDVARTPTFGANSALNIPGYSVAAKTGTTNDNRDNWTMGYAPNVVVGVWHGNTDNSPMRGTSGFSGAAPIWNAVMRTALQREAPIGFQTPAGVQTVTICADSGTLPSEACLNRRQELVAISQPPPGPDQDIYRTVRVDTLSGLVANEFCPDFTEEKLYLNISDPTAFSWINNTGAGNQWAQQRGIDLPAEAVPTTACNPNIQQPLVDMNWPTPNGEVQGLVEVRGRVLVYNFASYQLEYGIGADPDTFQVVDGPYAVQHPNPELLGVWDVSQLPNGPYTVRLAIQANGGGYAHLDTVVRVNNPLATETPIPTVQFVTQTPTPSWTPLIPGGTTPTPFIVTATPLFTTPTVAAPTPIVITNTPPPAPVSTALPPLDPASAIPVVYGAQATGFITNAQWAAYYRFDGVAGDQIQLTAEVTTGDLDTMVFILDAGQNPLAEDDDGGVGTNSELNFTLPTNGTYYVAISRFDVGGGFTTGEFRMTLNKLN